MRLHLSLILFTGGESLSRRRGPGECLSRDISVGGGGGGCFCPEGGLSGGPLSRVGSLLGAGVGILLECILVKKASTFTDDVMNSVNNVSESSRCVQRIQCKISFVQMATKNK